MLKVKSSYYLSQVRRKEGSAQSTVSQGVSAVRAREQAQGAWGIKELTLSRYLGTYCVNMLLSTLYVNEEILIL